VRGSLPVAWSLVKGEIVGCTCHRVSNVLDGGDWIFRDAIDIRRGVSFDEIIYQSCVLAGDQMGRALADLMEKDAVTSTPFSPGEAGPNFKWSSKVTSRAREVLATGTYPLLVDDDVKEEDTKKEQDYEKEDSKREQHDETQERYQKAEKITKAAGGAAAEQKLHQVTKSD